MLVDRRCICKGREAPQPSAYSLWEVNLGCSAALLRTSTLLKNVVATWDVKMGHFQKKKKKSSINTCFFKIIITYKFLIGVNTFF